MLFIQYIFIENDETVNGEIRHFLPLAWAIPLDLKMVILSDLEARELSSSNVFTIDTRTQAGLTDAQLNELY